ncbi:tyrosine-protein phosphatase [Levilactobacillus sp. HBUAS70063]|uniref:tyrosine-protein phosphatase n=1 Tax=Levilactobacillus sp. HBUAS70063 TaxID=3109359 RepID=UPI0031329E3B
MYRSTIVKSLSLAGVVLSLMSVGVSSASAATNAQASLATETRATGNRTTNSQTDPIIQSRLTKDEMAEQIALYGNVNDTLVKLSGTKNTRDIGGYKTTNGQFQIRPHRLLRSDNLNKINNSDKHILAANYHVTSIVDFRTDGQISGLPDQHIAGVDNTSISILGEKAYTDSVALSPDFAGDGGFYVQQLEFGQSAIQGYNHFLNMLLQNNYATLYHCSSGKDRTGIATVLIMSILGMDEQTITNDFMQSYQTGRTVKLAWLKEYFREIKTRYVTMNRYITNVIGFSRPQQEKLRAMYLVSTDGTNKAYQEGDKVMPDPVPAPAKPKPTPAPTPAPTQPAPTPEPSKPAPQPNPEPAKPTPAPAPTQPTPAPSPAPAKPMPAPAPLPTPITPAPFLTPALTPAANATTASQPHKHKKVKKAKNKIVSSKKLSTKYTYRLKARKQLFKDAHLQKSLGKTTKKHQRTTWKLTNVERIKIKGKTHTYYKVKDHAGHKGWILKAHVVKVKLHQVNHQR